MIVLLNVYTCALRKKSVPLLPGGTVKYTHHSNHSKFTYRAPTEINKKGAVAKVRILVELGILKTLKDI